jgi:hypothetical protein
MTKFTKFNPNGTTKGSKETTFKYEISGTTPNRDETSFIPTDFENVAHLYFDITYELDVFMAWDEDIDEAWILYGTKGDEFD